MSQTTNPLRKHFRQPAIHLKLPSGGRFYPQGTIVLPPTGEVPILPMTAVDEITSRTPDALFNGSAVIEIIGSCVPNIRDPWSVNAVDLNALLVAVRLASYGHAMDLDVICPACNTEESISVDLRVVNDTLRIGDYETSLNLGDLEFWFRPIPYKFVNDNNQMQMEQQQAMQNMVRQGMAGPAPAPQGTPQPQAQGQVMAAAGGGLASLAPKGYRSGGVIAFSKAGDVNATVEDDDDELNELNGKQQRGDLKSQIIYCFIFNF
jgi:hypothetical protein